jgi:cephalosporin hydroxylase
MRTWEDLEGWFDFQEIYDEALRETPDHGLMVEVGAWMGRSCAYQAQNIKALGRQVSFYVVDIWRTETEDLFPIFLNNMIETQSIEFIRPIKMSSPLASRYFQDNSLSFAFIDADHTKEAVLLDLKSWYPKVKSGRVIAGHDYPYGEVKEAVHEFFASEIESDAFSTQGSSWLFRKP